MSWQGTFCRAVCCALAADKGSETLALEFGPDVVVALGLSQPVPTPSTNRCSWHPGMRDSSLPALGANWLSRAAPAKVSSMRQETVGVGILSVRCDRPCADITTVIKINHSSLPSKGKPEFHAEWLRDEPCDATTTCPRKTGVWCQLLPATAGNMRFGVVSALFAEAARI
jgi:hypothetical protein